MKKRILTEDDKTSIDTSIKELNNNYINTDKAVKKIVTDLTQNESDIGDINKQLETKLNSGDDISNCTTNGKTIKSLITDLNTKTTNNSKLTNDVRTGRALKFWIGTQAEYDSIGTKDGNTLYLIKEKA